MGKLNPHVRNQCSAQRTTHAAWHRLFSSESNIAIIGLRVTCRKPLARFGIWSILNVSPVGLHLKGNQPMTFSTQRVLHLSLPSFALAMLAACGGGGSDSGSSDTSGSTVGGTQPDNSVALVTTVPASTYDTVLTGVFEFINTQRSQCAFGKLAQNSKLDAAALAHAHYLDQNLDADPHTELLGRAGYSGASPTDRAMAAGYTTTGLEVYEDVPQLMGMRTASDPMTTRSATVAMDLTRTLTSAPFHAYGFFGPYVDIGMAYVVGESAASGLGTDGLFQGTHTLDIEFGVGPHYNGQQPVAGTGVRTFPCEGSTNVAPALYGEWLPTGELTPGRALNTHPVGSPIMVFSEVDKALTLTHATVTHVATGQDVAIYALRTKANDPNASMYRNEGFGYILPDQPLAADAQYRVTLDGSEGGKAFTKSFTFTTGH